MARSSKRSAKQQTLMGSHQRCWIWGRMAVTETLSAARWPPLELRLDQSLSSDQLKGAMTRAEALGIPVILDSAAALARLCRSAEHQGYVAKMPPFPYDNADDLLLRRPERAFYVLLDAVQDPFNFGAILRSADGFGVDAVFVGASNQAEVNSLVVRASAGAVNHVPLAKVDDLSAWLGRLKQAGIAVVGTAPDAPRDVSQFDFQKPVALVLGNEAIGIRPEIVRDCEECVAIKQSGRVGSLNAAVSAGILFYEVSRQRSAAAPCQSHGTLVESAIRTANPPA